MTLTPRGKISAFVATVVVIAVAVVGFFVVFPDKAPAFVRRTMGAVGLQPSAPPPTCPLTGLPAPGGVVPHRPALAIKVENAPEARPQTGLNGADIVYEEPVEGGYTRFIAIFQCRDAGRVGPVRSARMTDIGVLAQFGKPLLGYAGGASAVRRELSRARLVDLNYIDAAKAYTRDPGRVAPHNLYTTTKALWKLGLTLGHEREGAPRPVFSYADGIVGRSKKVGTVHIPYSSVSDLYWAWSRKQGAWVRSHGSVPHTLTDGSQVSAADVVVMQVGVQASSIRDVVGNPSPEVTLTGAGKAYVFRDGRMIVGRWQRPKLSQTTTFVAKDGTRIALAPGRTWVELVPTTVRVSTSR